MLKVNKSIKLTFLLVFRVGWTSVLKTLKMIKYHIYSSNDCLGELFFDDFVLLDFELFCSELSFLVNVRLKIIKFKFRENLLPGAKFFVEIIMIHSIS